MDTNSGGAMPNADPSPTDGMSARIPQWAIVVTVSTLPFLFALLRVGVVAGFNPGTAAAILTDVNPVAVVLGGVMPLIPTLMMLLTGWLLVVPPERWWRTIKSRFGVDSDAAHIVVGLLLSATITVVPWPTVALVGGVLIIAFAIRVLRPKYRWFARRNNASGFVVAFLVSTLLVTVLSDEPWMPMETVRLEGEDEIVGVVIGTNGNFTSLVENEERLVIRVPSSEVAERQICGTGSSPSLLGLWLQHDSARSYPPCSTG